MNRNSGRILLLAALAAASLASLCGTAEAVVIESVTPPSRYMPGDRELEAVINLEGLSRSGVTVHVVYSKTQEDLESIRPAASIVQNAIGTRPSGRASCRLVSGKLQCSFIFPHDAHPSPNILSSTEMAGGEPSTLRTTRHTYTPTKATNTDRNPVQILGGEQAYCRLIVTIGSGTSAQYLVSPLRSFTMKRRMVFALMGDSYIAGEGSPNIEGSTSSSRWTVPYCHQSDRSGHVRAYKAFRMETPEVSTAMKNTSCSGAEIDQGMLFGQKVLPGEQTGDSPARPEGPGAENPLPARDDWPSQFAQLEQWMASKNRKTVDVLLMNIGGNNAGFGSAASECLQGWGDCGDNGPLRELLAERLEQLPAAYEILNLKIQSLNIDEVMITEYPSPLKSSSGRICNDPNDTVEYGSCWGFMEDGVDIGDWEYLRDNLLTPLNAAVNAAATAYGWQLINTDGTAGNHGLCNCTSPYFNTIGQALTIQGDFLGSVHPNPTGHRAIYTDLVLREFKAHASKLQAKAALKEKLNATETEPATFTRLPYAPSAALLDLQRLRLAQAPLPRFKTLSKTTSITTTALRPTPLDIVDVEKLIEVSGQ